MSAVPGVKRLNTVNGPSGDARSAAMVSRDRKAERNETGDCGGGRPAQVAARARQTRRPMASRPGGSREQKRHGRGAGAGAIPSMARSILAPITAGC